MASGPWLEANELVRKLARKNNQLKGMVGKVGTDYDDISFRSRLAKHQEQAQKICREVMGILKANKGRGNERVVKQVTTSFQEQASMYKSIEQQLSAADRAVVRRLSTSQSRPENTAESVEQQGLLAEQAETLDAHVDEIEQRNKAVKEVERNVTELNEMFMDLRMLVNEQQESIDTIEDNVYEAKLSTENAAKQLSVAEDYQKKSRKRACCISMCVLMILVAIIIIVVVLKKK